MELSAGGINTQQLNSHTSYFYLRCKFTLYSVIIFCERDTGGVPWPRCGWCHRCRDSFARKVNTPFRQDGPALRVPSGTTRVFFSFPDSRVGFRTAGSSQRSDEVVGITGDECYRVHCRAVFIFCAVCCDAATSQRIGGGNDRAWNNVSVSNTTVIFCFHVCYNTLNTGTNIIIFWYVMNILKANM